MFFHSAWLRDSFRGQKAISPNYAHLYPVRVEGAKADLGDVQIRWKGLSLAFHVVTKRHNRRAFQPPYDSHLTAKLQSLRKECDGSVGVGTDSLRCVCMYMC